MQRGAVFSARRWRLAAIARACAKTSRCAFPSPARMEQGSLALGSAPPGSLVALDGRPLRVTAGWPLRLRLWL